MLEAAARQARSVDETAHRPYPLPSNRWTMGQTWESLVFVHWPVDADVMRPFLPRELEIEEFDGSAWVGIVPFRITGLRARGLLPIPGVSAFNELNVRTCVRAADGKPGVWFFSLDATSRLAVQAARWRYLLPYFDARMVVDDDGERVAVECARLGESGRLFSGVFRATGEARVSPPDSREYFLVERYCLYAEGRHALWRAEIHHPAWVLSKGEAEIGLNSIAPFPVSGDALCHVAERQDVVVWPLEPVASV
ncbi:MAG TPA: DUF2071 domain-containing protein [Gaiellaceae bacterium]|jgi:hypothetical protein